MNKEQQDILNEVYRKYADSHWTPPSNPKGKLLSDQLFSVVPMEHSKESFINKCKTNTEFSEKWGLKIEQRELSLEERYKIALPIWKEKYGLLANMMVSTNVDNTPYNIPTKLITMTYNDKTIESYEQPR
jgi:hypothetical protein